MINSNISVLVGCESSAVVRDAFRRLGCYAVSCDQLPSENPDGLHFQCDLLEVLEHWNFTWDIAIFHPPCTYVCSSGLHWNKRRPGREEKTKESLAFIRRLMEAPNVKRMALENPVGCISTAIRPPDQIIQPWQFGHPESKATCLWLRNLPPLQHGPIAEFKNYRCRCGNVFSADYGKYGCCESPARPLWDNMTASGQNKLSPGPDRWKKRSKTYAGIADAMARQWVDYIKTTPTIPVT